MLPAASGGLFRSIDSGGSFTRLTTVDEAYQIGLWEGIKGVPIRHSICGVW